VHTATRTTLFRYLIFGSLFAALIAAPAASARDASSTYTNPLDIQIPGGGHVESCADPSIVHGRTAADTRWYIYCTTDPLNDPDTNASGRFNFHLIAMLHSDDLVHWT
jgi:arabinan endo-1,5-alpha-L-arabinosidase